MKKKLLFLGAAGILAAGIYSCSQEREIDIAHTPEDTVNRSIGNAKDFLEFKTGTPALPNAYYRAGEAAAMTRAAEVQPLLLDAVEPRWEYVWVGESDEVVVTEVPVRLTRPIHYTVQVEKQGNTVSLATQPPYTRILIYEPKDGSSTFGFLATFLPDESYAGNLARLSSDPTGSDYTGIMLYSATDGTPLWGWRYENGEVSNTLLFGESDPAQVDPHVRILMGVGSGETTTRVSEKIRPYQKNDGGGDDSIWIDAVTCTASYVTPAGIYRSMAGYAALTAPYAGSQDIYFIKNVGISRVGTASANSGAKAPGSNPNIRPVMLGREEDDLPKRPLKQNDLQPRLTDEKTVQIIQPILDQLKNDCLGAAMIDYLGNKGVTIEYASTLSAGYASANTTTGNIKWTDRGAVDYIIYEELFHSYQVTSGGYDKNFRGSMEIEAKVAVWKYMQRTGQKFNSDIPAWEKIGTFAQNPTRENYTHAIDGIARMQYFNYATDDDWYMLWNLNKISPC